MRFHTMTWISEFWPAWSFSLLKYCSTEQGGDVRHLTVHKRSATTRRKKMSDANILLGHQ